MATKNSIKDVARVEKVPLDEVNKLCKAIPDRLPNNLKMNLTNAIKSVPELQMAESSRDVKWHNTIRYAKMLEGTVRGTGIHACGFIICKDPISDWVPLSTADDPDFKDQKTNCTQYDGHVIESTGLIKMDFLGLKTLSELKEACAIIKQHRGIDIDLDTIPIDDPKTYELYQQGRTVGTFQFESNGMQKYLRELKPTVFEDLVAMNALYRPGPMDKIPSFIARKHGKEEIQYDIPVMEEFLKDTYGVTVYQEQVMLLSRKLGGFTRGQSDKLRKAMGKKQKAIVDEMKPMFLEGGRKNGHDAKTLEKIWGEWEKFAEYAFNKSHAACYSWVAYQTAYLKANYPAEFMAAIMSRRRDKITEITKLMDECKQMGIATLGPDVNESFQNFGVNQKGEIRFGLAAIKGMGDNVSQSIIDEREKNGPYQSIFDFVQRMNYSVVNRKTMESLALSGALDGFGLPRETYFASTDGNNTFLDNIVRYGQLYQAERQQMQNSLFGDSADVMIATPAVPVAEAWNDIEKLNRERELVGIYLSAHPLDEYGFILETMCNTRCKELENKEALVAKKEVTLGGIVVSVKDRMTKKGKPMGIVTIEDFEDSGELVFFDEEWGKWRGMFIEGSMVFVRGKFFQKYPGSSFIDMRIEEVQYLQTVKEKRVERFTICFGRDSIDETIADDLATLIDENPGNTELCFRIIDHEHATTLGLRAAEKRIDVNRKILSYLETAGMSYDVN